jgi:hypothetical protein
MRGSVRAPLAVLALLCAAACGKPSPEPERFATPEAAAQAIFAAVGSDDADKVLDVLGHQYAEQLVTSDWDAGHEMRQRIAAAAKDKMVLEPAGEGHEGQIQIVLGEDAWPFPFPLVRDASGKWHFDTPKGVEVIVDRRIGRDELAAIAILDAYVDAQIEYASELHDGADLYQYAQRLGSRPGKQDGLYWEAKPGEPESPFGPLVKGAEAYLATHQRGDPIRGYYFRVLERQGPHAPGGAYSYLVDGHMVKGFGLVAFPADPGNTGIMTFVVNQTGKIYQKDLGDEGSEVDSYDPDDSWTLVRDVNLAEALAPPPAGGPAPVPGS